MSERGAAAVEFALVAPLVLLALVGVVEVALAGRAQLVAIHAAREGVRQAATHPDADTAIDAARHALGPELSALTRVSVRRPDVVGRPAEVTVVVRYRVAGFLFGGFPLELRARSAMRVER